MTSILKRTSFTLGLMALAFLWGAPTPSLAQESVSFSVSPTIFDMTANPGQTWQSTLRIINPNSFPLTLYVERNHFVPKEEDGIPKFIPLSQEQGDTPKLADWLDVPTQLTIEAEQMVELPVKISIPADAPPGGHYAALMISTKPNSESGTSFVQTSQIISALIFLRVTGDIKEESTIRSFRTSDYFLSAPEATFEIRVENKGNVHVQPQGEIKIFNMWGQERGVIPVNQKTLLGNVLPLSVRKFSFVWSSEWSITDIGRYTAVATLAYGVDGRQFMSADTAFWIIPWKILLSLLIVVGGFIFLVSWAIKLYVRKVLQLAGVPTNNSVVEKPISKKILTKDVAAPLEIGILDLRTRLKNTHGPLKQRVAVYINFVIQYWKFFFSILMIIIFIALLVWFVSGAMTPKRDFLVTDPSTGEVISGKDEAQIEGKTSGGNVPVALVNRTNDLAQLDVVSKKLSDIGFKVVATSSEDGAEDERTIVVYSPEVAGEALFLSRALDNALLSSFSSAGTSSSKIVVYIGTSTKSAQ